MQGAGSREQTLGQDMLPQAPSRLLPAQLRPSSAQVCQLGLSLPQLSLLPLPFKGLPVYPLRETK